MNPTHQPEFGLGLGSISGPQLPVKSTLLLFFFAICDILGVKIIGIDPLEPNIWLYCVYYANCLTQSLVARELRFDRIFHPP